jgi:hypothetical protein
MARAEQLAAGPTGKTRPRGVFSADERPGRLQEPSPSTNTPRFLFFWEFFIPAFMATARPHACLTTHCSALSHAAVPLRYCAPVGLA